jgi:hypothetical protein
MFFKNNQPAQQPASSYNFDNSGSFNKEQTDLDVQIAALKQMKMQQMINNQQNMSNPIVPKNENQEALFFKNLADCEAIVELCKEKGWETKKDWDSNNIPMKQLLKDLIKSFMNYSGWKMEQLQAELNSAKMEKVRKAVEI